MYQAHHVKRFHVAFVFLHDSPSKGIQDGRRAKTRSPTLPLSRISALQCPLFGVRSGILPPRWLTPSAPLVNSELPSLVLSRFRPSPAVNLVFTPCPGPWTSISCFARVAHAPLPRRHAGGTPSRGRVHGHTRRAATPGGERRGLVAVERRSRAAKAATGTGRTQHGRQHVVLGRMGAPGRARGRRQGRRAVENPVEERPGARGRSGRANSKVCLHQQGGSGDRPSSWIVQQ
eukprot:scaffold47_cov334-Pavlova_lutheri.AAC.38